MKQRVLLLLCIIFPSFLHISMAQDESVASAKKIHIAGSALYNLHGNTAKVGESLTVGYRVVNALELNLQGGYFSESPAIKERFRADTWFMNLGASFLVGKQHGFCMIPRLGVGIVNDKQENKKWKTYFACDLNVEVRYYLTPGFFSGLTFGTMLPFGETDARVNTGLVIGVGF